MVERIGKSQDISPLVDREAPEFGLDMGGGGGGPQAALPPWLKMTAKGIQRRGTRTYVQYPDKYLLGGVSINNPSYGQRVIDWIVGDKLPNSGGSRGGQFMLSLFAGNAAAGGDTETAQTLAGMALDVGDIRRGKKAKPPATPAASPPQAAGPALGRPQAPPRPPGPAKPPVRRTPV